MRTNASLKSMRAAVEELRALIMQIQRTIEADAFDEKSYPPIANAKRAIDERHIELMRAIIRKERNV